VDGKQYFEDQPDLTSCEFFYYFAPALGVVFLLGIAYRGLPRPGFRWSRKKA
jgi:hypothetical protein